MAERAGAGESRLLADEVRLNPSAVPAPYLADADFVLHVGDALEVLRRLPAESVHCCVTSPPYWGLRDYGTGTWDGGDTECDHTNDRATDESQRTKSRNFGTARGRSDEYLNRTISYGHICGKCGASRSDKQLGLERTPDEYVANMVSVFREVRRVLRADGTLWLNIGDSYAGHNAIGWRDGNEVKNGGVSNKNGVGFVPGYKPKDLVGIPWRLAFALQADGWYLRSDIIWSKPNPMPESVTDRPTKAHEYLFLLSKSPRYFYDAAAIAEPAAWDRWGDQTVGEGSMGWIQPKAKPKLTGGAYDPPGQAPHGNAREPRGKALTSPRNDGNIWNENNGRGFIPVSDKRNKRSVWEIPTRAYPEAHFAVFPPALVEPCIKAGTSERGCCPVCGAPWERETDRGVPSRDVDPSSIDRYGTGEAGVHRKVGGQYQKWLDENPRQTTGWRKTCPCETAPRVPEPCVVLDPFMGSGTTALVARRLGRKSIGIELNPEYAQLAARRLQQQSLFACVIDESAGVAEEVTDHV